LAHDSPYRFAESEESDIGIKVNNFEDLCVDKLLTFYGRAEARDAIDLYFILETEDFSELTRKAALKDPRFDLYWLAAALNKVQTFPDTITRWPTELLVKMDAAVLKKNFSELSTRILAEIATTKNNV
jgi:predicted nucleotidyltransferase component of viral defense system